MTYHYKYARPALTVDCVVFGLDEGDLKLLLIQRRGDPFKNCWALPGGFVRIEEELEEAALRELQEETGVSKVYLEQLCTVGTVNRDPRERVVTVAYYALVNLGDYKLAAATDASDAAWFPVRSLPNLAFDHKEIISLAIKRLQSKLHYEPVGFELLPSRFTLTELQRLYEVVWERQLDKRNFRKKFLSLGLLVPLNERQRNVPHRAAQFYRFDARKYKQMKRDGLYFEI